MLYIARIQHRTADNRYLNKRDDIKHIPYYLTYTQQYRKSTGGGDMRDVRGMVSPLSPEKKHSGRRKRQTRVFIPIELDCAPIALYLSLVARARMKRYHTREITCTLQHIKSEHHKTHAHTHTHHVDALTGTRQTTACTHQRIRTRTTHRAPPVCSVSEVIAHRHPCRRCLSHIHHRLRTREPRHTTATQRAHSKVCCILCRSRCWCRPLRCPRRTP